MRRNNKVNSQLEKQIARQKYAERRIDKRVKWSLAVNGKVMYKELVELQDELNIKIYS